jgi:peptidoglycan/LPS O-acetylase OafA/YrhL
MPPVTQKTKHSTTIPYRADIDGLRAVAVLSVIGFHAFPYWIMGGFVGVDIFFVISGYLISTIIIDSLERDRFSFVEFYSRRIKRIFPALLLVLIACFAFGWMTLYPDEYKQLGKHIAGSAGFVPNFLFWNESGYFDNSAETKPLLHLWSLGVEEQFYIFWPPLLWLAWKQRMNLWIIAIVILVVSFVLNIVEVSNQAVVAFYSPQTRFWELMIGSVLSYTTYHKQSIFPSFMYRLDLWLGEIVDTSEPRGNGKTLRNVWSLLGAAMLASSVFFITKDKLFPGWWALLPTLGTMLIISAGSQAWFNRVVLSSRVLVWFGLISFPLYLWHWPLLSFARILESESPSLEVRIVAVTTSIVLAWLTYRLIEKPIRFGNYGKVKTITLLSLMFIVGLIGYYTYSQDGLVSRENIKHEALVNKEFVGAFWEYTNNDICLNRYPFKEAGEYEWWFCSQSKNEKPTIILLGNSYANQYYPGFAKNIKFRQHNVLSIGNCGPNWVYKDEITKVLNETEFSGFSSLGAKKGSPCSGYRSLEQLNFINNIIKHSASVQLALLISPGKTSDEKYIRSLRHRIDFLEKNKVKVVVFTPHIKPTYDIKGCFARPLKKPSKDCEFSLTDYEKHLEYFDPVVHAISQTNPNVSFFDPNKLFCDADNCSFIRNKMPLLRDEYFHISEYGAIELADIFENWARVNIPDIFGPVR